MATVRKRPRHRGQLRRFLTSQAFRDNVFIVVTTPLVLLQGFAMVIFGVAAALYNGPRRGPLLFGGLTAMSFFVSDRQFFVVIAIALLPAALLTTAAVIFEGFMGESTSGIHSLADAWFEMFAYGMPAAFAALTVLVATGWAAGLAWLWHLSALIILIAAVWSSWRPTSDTPLQDRSWLPWAVSAGAAAIAASQALRLLG